MNTLISQLSRSWLVMFVIIFSGLIINFRTLGQIPSTGLVATPDSNATQIASQILKQGGNAVDAGVAAMYALAVVRPYACGPGGGGFMLIWLAKEKKSIVIDFREQAPQKTNPAIFYQDKETFNIYTEYDYQSICVPGFVAGAEQALRSYGTLPPQQVLQPALELASQGFPASEALVNISTEFYRIIESNRATSAIFFPDWFPITKGQIQIRPDLAATFSLISEHGAKVFYLGEIASEIARELHWNNGLLQLSDLKTYEPKTRSVVHGRYRDIEIIASPPPSSGGTALIELLSILEKFEISKYRLNSGRYIHLVVEAMKQVFEDREAYYMGDPQFARLNPELALADQHIRDCVSQIDTSSASVALNPINSQTDSESSSGSHISILDRDGNAISISLTLSGYFGSAVTISKYGILLNNAMSGFSSQPGQHNSLAAGKRPQSSLAPTIVLKNQKPYLILGGSGAERIISMLAHIIINVVDFKLTLEEAVQIPRFHYNYHNDTIEMETRIQANDIEFLKQLGHKINLRTDFDYYFGSAQAILFDPTGQQTAAVNDVRQKGVVYVR